MKKSLYFLVAVALFLAPTFARSQAQCATTPFQTITGGFPAPPTVLDDIHIYHGGLTDPKFPCFSAGPGLRLSLATGEFGQLSVIQSAGANSSFTQIGDVLLRSGPTAHDLILSTQNPMSRIRFVTSNPGETERMTILNNGDVGIGNNNPQEMVEVGGSSAQSGLTIGAHQGEWPFIGYNFHFSESVLGANDWKNRRIVTGPASNMWLTPAGEIWLASWKSNTAGAWIGDPANDSKANTNAFIVSPTKFLFRNDDDGDLMRINRSGITDDPATAYKDEKTTFMHNKVFIGRPPADKNPGGEDWMLSVYGSVKVKELIVNINDWQTNWPDYVFDGTYLLPDLLTLELKIKKEGHLPEIPSSADIGERGVSVGDMQAKLLKKIEELTLYVIGLKKETNDLQAKIKALQAK